jgi:D-glycero-alpha-D-manno-heptose-7-phosphate kinase
MILARAPLRIPLGGGGTDLPSYYDQYGGFILSAGINKFVNVYLNRPAADSLLRIKYSKYEQVEHVDQIQHDLVRPALQLLNVNGGSLEIVSMADVPDGTGLGSSGAYLVALLTALYELRREKVPTQALAETACHIEMNLAGHPVGKHDHYLAAFGGITTLEIQCDGRVQVSPLNISVETVEQLKAGTLLYYTGITRASGQILAEQKCGSEAHQLIMIDSLHRTKEIGYRVKECLETGDLDTYGRLLDEHWQNKKRRSSLISVGCIDRWYDRAVESGALGGKIMGAGGGGFLMLYAPPHAKANVRKAMHEEGLKEMKFEFDFEGAKVMVNF